GDNPAPPVEARGPRPPPPPPHPPQPGAAVAEDALPQADGQALPEETEGQPASAGVRAALAGGKRLLPAQAAARLGPWCQVGRLARARVLPARAHPQHHAPRSYRIEGFNRATTWQTFRQEYEGKVVSRLGTRTRVEVR